MARKADIIPALPEHIPAIADHVRDADKLEFAANLRTAAQVMAHGLRVSTVAWIGTVDGIPVCMFGVAPVDGFWLQGHGRPWMVGTRFLDDHALLFLRRCRGQVKHMLDLYPVLTNYVDARNDRAIQWLRWLGFRVSDVSRPCGIMNVPFFHFELRRGDICGG